MRALTIIVVAICSLAIASTVLLHLQTREAAEELLLGRAIDRARSFALTVRTADVDDGVLDRLSRELLDSTVVSARVFASGGNGAAHEDAMRREAVKRKSHLFEFERDTQGRHLLTLWYPLETTGADRRRDDLVPLAPGSGPRETPVLKLQLDATDADRLIGRSLMHACLITLLLALLVALTFRQVRLAVRKQALERDLLEQRRFAELGRLSAVLAHEVRNPLVAIKGFAQYAMESLGDQDRRRGDMETIVAESGRLERLVKSLLLYAKPTAPQFQTQDLGPIISGLAERIGPDAAEKRIEVAVELRSAPVPVSIDADQIIQALWNIASNALESMDAGGVLRIALSDGDRHARISISDTGEGIAPEILTEIFEPYFTTRASGTGLGLAVTRRIVSDHGGEIQVESTPGGGSIFTVVLPKTRGQSVG